MTALGYSCNSAVRRTNPSLATVTGHQASQDALQLQDSRAQVESGDAAAADRNEAIKLRGMHTDDAGQAGAAAASAGGTSGRSGGQLAVKIDSCRMYPLSHSQTIPPFHTCKLAVVYLATSLLHLKGTAGTGCEHSGPPKQKKIVRNVEFLFDLDRDMLATIAGLQKTRPRFTCSP